MRLLAGTRDWLRGKGRRPKIADPPEAPPPPEFREGERTLVPKEYVEHDTVIPPEHFAGGGLPHR